MKFLHRLSAQPINRLLIVSFVLVSLVPLAVLGYKLYDAAWDSAWREINEKHRLLAMNMASPIRIYIADKRRMMGLLTNSLADALRRGESQNKVHQRLVKARPYMNDFSAVSLVNIEGKTLCLLRTDQPAKKSTEGLYSIYKDNAVFQSTLKSKRWSISGVERSILTGRPTVLMAFPVEVNKRLKAVLLGELKLDEIENLRRNIHFGEKGHSAIVDNHGRALAHPNPQWMESMKDLSHLKIVQKMLAGETGVTEFYSPFIKEMMVAGYTGVPELGWGIMVPQPKSEVEKQVRLLLYTQLGWALGGLALAILLAIFLARWITRPVNHLASAAHSLLSNKLEGSLPQITRHAPHEIKELSTALRSLVTGLQDSRSEIKQLNETLQTRIDEATNQLREANEKLKQNAALAEHANAAKSAFLANMSHEIRTPLTAIIGFSESLLDSNQTMSERVEAIQTVISSGNHLLNIINDILDISKVEAEKLEIEQLPMELLPTIHDVSKIAKIQAQEKGIDYRVDYRLPLPDRFISDPVRLKQIILNVVSNGIKFTEKGSVTLLVKYNVDRNQMQFDVIDSGIGISDEKQQALFQPFTQADVTTTRNFGGTGLGLYLSRSLAKKLGGDITVSSKAGKGSCFSIRIAAQLVDDSKWLKDISNPQEEDSSSRPMSLPVLTGQVLLVDDNINNQKLFSLYLEKLGVDVSVAENGEEAIEMAIKQNYDLILMDMQMPVLDGVEAVRILRQRKYNNPIIALTANAMREDVEKYLEAGCDDLIAKPVNRDKFNQVIASYLKENEPQVQVITPLASTLLAEGGMEFLELVESFVEGLPAIIEEIVCANTQQKLNELKKIAHDLKGAGGSYGYPAISDIAARIEFSIVSRDYQNIARLIDELDIVNQRIQMALTEINPDS